MAGKKTSLKPINKGTIYDIPGSLRRFAREIEHGEMGDVTQAIVIYRRRNPDGHKCTGFVWWGVDSPEEAVYMLELTKHRWLKDT